MNFRLLLLLLLLLLFYFDTVENQVPKFHFEFAKKDKENFEK